MIEEAGLALVLSCWESSEDIVYFYNYWDIGPDANALIRAELLLPDVPRYGRFAKLWRTETKDLALRINPARAPLQVNAGERWVYLRVVYQVPFVSLAEFVAVLEAAIVPFARAKGWAIGDAYMGVTGVAGTVVQIWAVPAE